MVENGAGFDVTSGGELYRALTAGGRGDKIVFAGVGKTDAEFRTALEHDVFLFNVESEDELHALADVAKALGKSAPVALRVNPDLPPKTHVKTDTSVKGVKFGLDIETVLDVARGVVGNPHVRIVGLHMHLGSPILSTQPYRDGAAKGLTLIEQLRAQGHPIGVLNMGGGFGIHYRKQEAQPAVGLRRGHRAGRAKGEVPAGAGAGPLHRRQRRPARQPRPVQQGVGRQALRHPGRRHERSDSADAVRFVPPHLAGRAGRRASRPRRTTSRPTFRGRSSRTWSARCASRAISWPRTGGCRRWRAATCWPIFSAGAYGMSMSSNYNSRPRAAEVLVDGASHRLVRRRETFQDLVRPEVEV